MAYVDPFDTTTPAEGADISLGNDNIRELKRAINERLATFFQNWPNGDPLDAIGAPILLGMRQGEDIGSFPGSTLKVGSMLYDQQEKKFYSRGEGGAAPMELELVASAAATAVVATGTTAALPNPPATPFYWATDTNTLYYNESNVWVKVNKQTRKIRLGILDARHIAADAMGHLLPNYFAYANLAPPEYQELHMAVPVPRGSRIRFLRLWSRSSQTAGAFGRVEATLYKFDRTTPDLAPTAVVSVPNQDGDNTYKEKVSTDLNYTPAEAELLYITIEVETFTNNVNTDAIFGYVEVEYEEV